MILNTTTMSKITEMMIRKPSLKYRDVRNYEGEYYDWAAGEHLLKKGTSVHELFHPLEHRMSRCLWCLCLRGPVAQQG